MRYFLVVLFIVLVSPAFTQVIPDFDWKPVDSACSKEDHEDKYSLTPHPEVEGQYIFKYWNSKFSCSEYTTEGIRAEDGFRVVMRVDVNVDDDRYGGKEMVTITPPEGYIVYPADPIRLKDGEEGEILILLPLS